MNPKWLVRIVLAVLVPVVVLVLIEVGLRIGGYGYRTAYFVEVPGQDVYTANNQFSLRFFPPSLRRGAWPVYLAKTKPPGAYRIFVLGGSAAQGVPDPAFGFARILETMLVDAFPGETFEIVVTAMTAINSHVVLPIARECAELEPDLFVVLLGNNEVVGPFGAGTVFQGFTPSLTLIRAHLAIKTTKLGQLASDLATRLGSGEGDEQWRGMEMFMGNQIPADDPRLAVVYRHFRRNLQDIVTAADGADANTILCTVPVNLRDCSPFASMHREDLSAEALARWEGVYATGIALAAEGQYDSAIEQFLSAQAIDDRFAELHFRLAQCYLATGQPEPARQGFSLARELDTLRFRADQSINQTIREVAAEQIAREAHLADAERALAASVHSPDGVSGETLFYEHVHMTFEGNYEVARTVFEQVIELLPRAITSRAQGDISPPSLARCVERMQLTAWQRAQMLTYILEMTKHPPFTAQFDHDQRQAALTQRQRQFQEQGASDSGPGP
jgi:tetratricopeptide (TPR) repeat protein